MTSIWSKDFSQR